jgi:hypothetical protein
LQFGLRARRVPAAGSGPPLMDRRDANEFRIRAFAGAEVIAFICECADSDCRRTVMLTPGAYISRREHGDAILFAGHEPVEDAPMAAERELPVIAPAASERRASKTQRRAR